MSYTGSYRRILARMGYYDYQSGLIYRHLNQESGWDSHLERCRNYILKAVDLFNPSKITVLGSGWLLELPVAELIERNVKITLVDIIHPPEVVKQAGSKDNVELVESDVTGGLIEEVWKKTHGKFFFRKPDDLDDLDIPVYDPGNDPGMIISLNLITQLETLLVRYLGKKASIPDEQIYLFRKKIQESHIRFLSRYNSVLITDCEEIITEKSGGVKKVPTLLAEIPFFSAKEEWTWNFDLKGADYYNSRSIMRVEAYTINGYGS